MELTKAIEILTIRAKDFRPASDPDEADATQLGIEALLFIKLLREGTPGLNASCLNTETPSK